MFNTLCSQDDIIDKRHILWLQSTWNYRAWVLINCFFILRSLWPTTVQYTSFVEFSSDHRILWIDVYVVNALWSKIHVLICYDARWLKLHNHHLVRYFKKNYALFLQKCAMFEHACACSWILFYWWSENVTNILLRKFLP